MISQQEVLTFVIECLETSGIQYMVVGSFASNIHGTPRATQDADLVVETDHQGVSKLESALGQAFYFPIGLAIDAVQRRGMFNVIHIESGFKVDLIVRKDRPYSKIEFERRQRLTFAGRSCWYSSPEDTILTKLEWSRLAESERQFMDALGVARVAVRSLDVSYLKHWGAEINVSELLDKLLAHLDS